MLFAALSTSATADQFPADETKMSIELIEDLSKPGNLEVIVQFEQPSSKRHWGAVESTGAELLDELSVLHGGLISASPSSIAKLSRFNFVKHLELNVPLEYFFLPGDQEDVESMMHETVHVVNASMAWHRVIIGTDGAIKTESDLSFFEYDGEGATAVDLDTGIDGEHPDFDCGEPWSGEKLIWSAKWTGLAWVDAPNCNSDTSSGHGTHVGGTIAGNGDASAGRHLGTAKGASIVALGTGDGALFLLQLKGWSGHTNIVDQDSMNTTSESRIHGGPRLQPNNARPSLTDMLTYDNGVAVIFAAFQFGRKWRRGGR